MGLTLFSKERLEYLVDKLRNGCEYDPGEYTCSNRRHEAADAISILLTPILILNIEEVQTLYNLLERQYISHDNPMNHEVMDKLSKILRDNNEQLGRGPSTSA